MQRIESNQVISLLRERQKQAPHQINCDKQPSNYFIDIKNKQYFKCKELWKVVNW